MPIGRRPLRSARLCFAAGSFLAAGFALNSVRADEQARPAAKNAAEPVSFEIAIAPLLARHCLECLIKPLRNFNDAAAGPG